MIGSGAMLWFQDTVLLFLPKYMLDIAKEAHSDEALLATLAIVIWHFYNVHLNPERFPGSMTWWHGRISRQEMTDHHPLEYERITAEREALAEAEAESANEGGGASPEGGAEGDAINEAANWPPRMVEDRKDDGPQPKSFIEPGALEPGDGTLRQIEE
jgi:hypothetical protein